MKRQTGFTLVELVIVIAVLGILAGLAIPYFMEAREEAAKKECLANRTQIMRMFHAQQAVGYSGDLDGFLKEVTKEKDNENKYFTFVPKCADGGKYEVKVDFVTCDFPGHDEDLLAASSIPEDILKKFNDMIDSFYKDGVLDKDALNKLLGITNADDKTLTSNDLMRKAFFEKYGGWIEGIGVDGKPIYFKFHKTVVESLYMLMEIVILKIAEIGLRITFITLVRPSGIMVEKISGGLMIIPLVCRILIMISILLNRQKQMNRKF